MNSLIFGINGQDGYYLKHILEKENIVVYGVSRSDGYWIKGNVVDFNSVEALVKQLQPKYIFHFAANSTTRHDVLFENHEAISTGTLNILESVRLHCPKTKVFLSGSAVQFQNNGLPIDEQTPFEASSAYSVARIQSVYAGRYFRNKFGMQVYVGFFFHHDSPLRSEYHVNQKIAKAVQRIARGSVEKIELHNIEVQKEFNYAGDVMEAAWILVNQNKVYEAVIGSGKAYSIKDWLIYCFKSINRNWQDFVTVENNYVPEYKILVSNPQLIMSLGWQPKVNFSQLAENMLNLSARFDPHDR